MWPPIWSIAPPTHFAPLKRSSLASNLFYLGMELLMPMLIKGKNVAE